MIKKGLFISFEGIDGSGKITQARLLADFLRDNGCLFALVRDLGGTMVAEQLRSMLKSSLWTAQRDEITELLLHLAARCHLYRTHIQPMLCQGYIVVSDRFCDSTLVYQGDLGYSRDELAALNLVASDMPDLTFLLDIEPSAARCRMRSRENADAVDIWDSQGIERMSKLRERYLTLLGSSNGRIKLLDGSEPADKINNRIVQIVKDQCESEQVFGWKCHSRE